MNIGRKHAPSLLMSALLALSLSGCKVLSLEEDRLSREQQSGNFDAAKFVNTLWTDRVLPFTDDTAIEASLLLNSLATQTITDTGKQYGRQAGEGSPWSFLTKGSGEVISVDRSSRQGYAVITIDDGKTLELLLGPVLFSTSIRDALNFISFNDFANQIVFADVGNELTAMGLNNNQIALSQLRVGSIVEFTGAFSLYSANDTIRLSPIQIRVK